ncbi:hypothetical protein [Paraburkholderia phosphatilytica]|uniref:hypothetical protein n=1 Tax=Paraburkholderia phosphatilytica TaxID=2282883 RepID=UPI000E4F76AB|nr:hypothetical protein [Paraburkholderia phosphatilytica]
MSKTTRPSSAADASAASQQDLLTIGYAMKSTLVAVRQARQIVQGCAASRDAQTALEILEHVHAVLDAYVKTSSTG